MSEEDLSLLDICASAGAAIGALAGLGLSFTALSPLVMGGMIGFILPGLATILCAGTLIYKFYKKKSI